MKKKLHGPSLYYASDKNIYDALSQNKVDLQTISKLFHRRNTLVSNKSKREKLAERFSMLNHDYYDYRDIVDKLGVASRRERTSTTYVKGLSKDASDDISSAAHKLKEELEAGGDVVHINRSKEENKITLSIQYSTIDHSKSELSQVQVHDGVIELRSSDDGITINNTHNEYINSATEVLLGNIQKEADEVLEEEKVNLFGVTDPKLRSRFFYDLTSTLNGYTRLDVTDVYVFKAPIDRENEDDDIDEDAFVERVFLQGKEVSRSSILNGLLDQENYYITRIRWISKEVLGRGDAYEIEAVFTDPSECTNFSFILVGVYSNEKDGLSDRRRTPSKLENEKISRLIEVKSHELMVQMQELFGSKS